MNRYENLCGIYETLLIGVDPIRFESTIKDISDRSNNLKQI